MDLLRDIFRGIRPLDYVLTAAMVALGAWLAIENVTASAAAAADLPHELDSQSPLIIPVFVLAALPILWRRRSVLAAIGVSFVVVAASVPAFGWITRCGFALPLAAALAYAVARFAGARQHHVVGLVGILGLELVTLVKDSSTGGLGGLAVGVPAAAILYGIGLFVQSRADRATTVTTPAAERVHA